MKLDRIIAVAVLLARLTCPAADGPDDGTPLSGAKAVWLQGSSKELNRQLVFSGTFEWEGGKKPRLVFASSNPCRVRLNGKLALSGECSETCQYCAFYFGCADPAGYPQLYRRLVDDFGPDRKLKGLYPRIHHSAPFIGNFLRLDWLGRQGLGHQVYGEMRGYFLPMAQSTGTLWENADSSDNGSCCHGFASHVAVFIVRDVVGLKSLDREKRIAVFSPPKDIPVSRCRLELPLGDETAVFGWECEKGSLRTDCALPDGWKVVDK